MVMLIVQLPFAVVVCALLLCSVDSYSAINGVRRFQPMKNTLLHSRNMKNIPSSFSLQSMSMSNQQMDVKKNKNRIPLPALIMSYIERVRIMTSSKNMISMIQKYSAICAIFLSTLLLNSRSALASTLRNPRSALTSTLAAAVPVLKSASVKGWDLFGRVPHDDWLFTTRALTDKSLLKRSFLESVVTELPDVLMNFRRRKRVNEIWVLGSGVGYFVLAVGVAALSYKIAMENNLKRMEREDSRSGVSRKGYGAIAKKGARKGVDIDGMNGWVDMENQDIDDKKKKDDDDDEEEEDE